MILKKDLINTSLINKEYNKNTFLNFAFKGAIIILNLILIPLLINVLGVEKFGIWQTLFSIISLASLLNFGLGNGLRNHITQLIANNRQDEIGLAIGAIIKKMVKIIGISLLLILPLILFFFEPDSFFKRNTIDVDEIRNSFLIFLSFFLVNIILSISNSISLGFLKSFHTNTIQFIYLAICYSFLLIYSIYFPINLIVVAFIFGATQSAVYLAFLVYQTYYFRIKIAFSNHYSLKNIYNLSINFFIIQGLGMIYLSIDNFVISASFGAIQTAEFSTINKIFFTIINLFSVFLIQFWNSVTHANEKREFLWIRKMIKKLLFWAIITFIFCLIISYFQREIIIFWLGKNAFNLSSFTFYLFSIYTLIHCVNAIFVNLQNGLGALKLQIISVFLALLIYIVGCFIFDLKELGYNFLIILKIIGTLTVLPINSLILKSVKAS